MSVRPQCTVLEYTSGWVIRSLISSKWVIGIKPLLQTPWGIQSSNSMFGLIFGPDLGSEDKKWAFFFQNCWFSIAFDIVVTRSFRICNWNTGLFDHFHRLSEVFKIQILYLDLFLGQIWAQNTKKGHFSPRFFHFPLLFVSIVIRCFGCFFWNCGKPHQSSPVIL